MQNIMQNDASNEKLEMTKEIIDKM